MIWWALLACSSGDPELSSQRRALDAWREGETLLATDPAGAAEAFARAQEAEPDDALLRAWHARALAASGDLEGAVDELEGVLAAYPRFAEARYNRAAYLARLGRLEEAGPELARAIDEGAARSREALVDPDFVPHLGHPALGFLPDEMLIVALDAPSGTLFWGSEANVRLRVVGGQGLPAVVEAEQLEGPIELISASEDVVESTEGPVRDLSWTFKVRGPGEVVLGPFTVHSGEYTSRVRAVRFPTTAPPGKDVDPGGPELSLAVPTAVAGDLQTPGIRLEDGVLDVKTVPGDRVDVSPRPASPPVRYELLDRSRPRWVMQRFRVEGTPRVVVTREGEVVAEGP